jgi:hypothetical protein
LSLNRWSLTDFASTTASQAHEYWLYVLVCISTLVHFRDEFYNVAVVGIALAKLTNS